MDYSLCCHTVTCYRREADGIRRQVLENCYLSPRHDTPTESYGKSQEKTFRLIIPGDRPVSCGDRIYWGTGPETVDWQSFVPALIPRVYEIGFAKPCFWDGQIIHWEAGSGKERG